MMMSVTVTHKVRKIVCVYIRTFLIFKCFIKVLSLVFLWGHLDVPQVTSLG